ncbi:hypothetical protein AVEN_231441-1 [Araneus ventricosus]|uniref:Uncharacterized protein n=1 Tax=Araneus ventricosus TaxID=182803 RepID=A0A4Y2WQ55_ARAVE|nr:hypothetical protein AVEN_231441-1 [Araneus ventricosus]
MITLFNISTQPWRCKTCTTLIQNPPFNHLREMRSPLTVGRGDDGQDVGRLRAGGGRGRGRGQLAEGLQGYPEGRGGHPLQERVQLLEGEGVVERLQGTDSGHLAEAVWNR